MRVGREGQWVVRGERRCKMCHASTLADFVFALALAEPEQAQLSPEPGGARGDTAEACENVA
jgi:hypothetical protein